MLRIVGKVRSIEGCAVDEVASAANDASTRRIGGDQERSRLAGGLKHGFNFRPRIATEDGINFFVEPGGISAENFLSNFLDASSGSRCRQMTRVGVDGDDVRGGGRFELALNLGRQAVSEGDSRQLSCTAQIVGEDDDSRTIARRIN